MKVLISLAQSKKKITFINIKTCRIKGSNMQILLILHYKKVGDYKNKNNNLTKKPCEFFEN